MLIVSRVILILGIISIPFIFYDISVIIFDLESALTITTTSGVIIFIGYIFILLFHLTVAGYLIRYSKRFQNIRSQTNTIITYGIISFLSIVMQKVMWDEVGREFYIEYPFPDETYFIIMGLLLNAVFIIMASVFVYKIHLFNKN